MRSNRTASTGTVGTALFDHTELTFDLPEVRHTTKEDVLVASAAFERTGMTFDLPDVRRAFTEPVGVAAAAFERTGLTFGFPGQISRTFSQTVPVRSFLSSKM